MAKKVLAVAKCQHCCIQLVSCKGIQISNIRQKRGYNNEELLSIDFSESDDKYQKDDDESLIVKKFQEINGIAQYRIIFLSEENKCNPIKSSFTEQEWLKFEADCGVNECIENLLNKYDDTINKVMTRYSVNLNRIIGTFNECTFINNRYYYSFSKEWPLQ
ncbi:hypothetical protein RCL_jg8567.t1 [Rhizophagus clarus]|uniref:Uncharacterized protein n=1 Tax=Rhizophagus clarus TaxID=94130 RepID=A0A8H3QYR6_9GLOM|nr:hypothetical protein RCL_jg8567.t1 [Rhizophagus clarus]